MSEEKLLKPVSFRLDDETKEKIKELSIELGLNQQGTLQTLLDTFEIVKSKEVLSDSDLQRSITEFEYFTSSVNKSYIQILHALQDAEKKAEFKVKEQLESKDKIIVDLQERIAQYKQLAAEEKENLKSHEEQYNEVRNTLDKRNKDIETIEKTLQNKELRITELAEDKSELKEKVEELKSIKQTLQDKANKYDEAILKLAQTSTEKEKVENTLTNKINSLESQNKSLIEQYNKQLEELTLKSKEKLDLAAEQYDLNLEKRLLEQEKLHRSELKELQNERKKEIDKYQQKYFELLEQMK